MEIEEEGLTVLDKAVGVLEVGLALADGLDLGAAEGDSGLKAFEEEEIVAGAAVLGGIALAGGDGIARAGGLGSISFPAGWMVWLDWRGIRKRP